MNRALILILGLAVSQPAWAGECADQALMGNMLGTIDNACSSHQLTEAGQRLFLDTVEKIDNLGGARCLEGSKDAMFVHMAKTSSKFAATLKTGKTTTYVRALCEAIADHLDRVAALQDRPHLVTRK